MIVQAEVQSERESCPSTRLTLRVGDRRTRRRSVEIDAAKRRDFQRRMKRVEPGHEAEHVKLDALHYADLDSEEPIKARLDAGAAGGAAEPRAVSAIVLADRLRRHGDFKFGRGAQDSRHE